MLCHRCVAAYPYGSDRSSPLVTSDWVEVVGESATVERVLPSARVATLPAEDEERSCLLKSAFGGATICGLRATPLLLRVCRLIASGDEMLRPKAARAGSRETEEGRLPCSARVRAEAISCCAGSTGVEARSPPV